MCSPKEFFFFLNQIKLEILKPLVFSMLIILCSNIMTMACFNWHGVSFCCILRVSNSNFLLKTSRQL